ncbi:MAG: sulfotransferase [Armatimonadetes bacterium]|nr:sulfotransferase [Armatimonadota bacterium]
MSGRPDAVPPGGPFFIVGTERSGSNLLRLVLNAHSRLFVPHPPHVMNFFRPLAPSYGNFYEMADDVARLVAWHSYPWDVAPSGIDLVRRAPERTLFGLYAAAHELYLAQVGKARWGCKSTFMIHEAQAIFRVYPDARLIFLTRDPRDVAVSARKSVFHFFHPYFVALRWRDEMRLGISLLDSGRAQVIRYEDLLAAPEDQVRRLCAFLGEGFEDRMLRFFESPEARKSASLCADWRNTDAAILRDNFKKYERELGGQEVALVETVCAVEMARLGYPTVAAPVPLPDAWRVRWYRVLDFLQRMPVEWKSFRGDRNWWLRLRKNAFVGWLRIKASMKGG